MEFGIVPPMFGMGVAQSVAEIVRLQQEAAQHALAQMQQAAQQQQATPTPDLSKPGTSPVLEPDPGSRRVPR